MCCHCIFYRISCTVILTWVCRRMRAILWLWNRMDCLLITLPMSSTIIKCGSAMCSEAVNGCHPLPNMSNCTGIPISIFFAGCALLMLAHLQRIPMVAAPFPALAAVEQREQQQAVQTRQSRQCGLLRTSRLPALGSAQQFDQKRQRTARFRRGGFPAAHFATNGGKIRSDTDQQAIAAGIFLLSWLQIRDWSNMVFAASRFLAGVHRSTEYLWRTGNGRHVHCWSNVCHSRDADQQIGFDGARFSTVYFVHRISHHIPAQGRTQFLTCGAAARSKRTVQ